MCELTERKVRSHPRGSAVTMQINGKMRKTRFYSKCSDPEASPLWLHVRYLQHIYNFTNSGFIFPPIF